MQVWSATRKLERCFSLEIVFFWKALRSGLWLPARHGPFVLSCHKSGQSTSIRVHGPHFMSSNSAALITLDPRWADLSHNRPILGAPCLPWCRHLCDGNQAERQTTLSACLYYYWRNDGLRLGQRLRRCPAVSHLSSTVFYWLRFTRLIFVQSRKQCTGF